MSDVPVERLNIQSVLERLAAMSDRDDAETVERSELTSALRGLEGRVSLLEAQYGRLVQTIYTGRSTS